MAKSAGPPGETGTGARVKIDLSETARLWVRQRMRVVGTGVALGCAFIVVGGIEVGLLAPRGPSLTYGIALLLIVLGFGVAFVSVYSGLINPVSGIRANASGITFDRRWGGRRTWDWKDTDFRLDIDDRSDDPGADDDARRQLFFEGPAGIYGNLTPSSLTPLLDTARAYGAVVSTRQLSQRERGRDHLVRRIRIRPRPIR